MFPGWLIQPPWKHVSRVADPCSLPGASLGPPWGLPRAPEAPMLEFARAAINGSQRLDGAKFRRQKNEAKIRRQNGKIRRQNSAPKMAFF